ncbi:DNA mismatch repair protein [Desulfonema limicola]|uniref:DNA mismatch repair protein MutL n=1 Tax=Desulfonema limicola TaxID=45656 RepID=A0A975B3F1_9BACT|nr:DNA mismatch repair endonuclease MutL [Desulfonema limicola]QTA78082.1 DNA mismatch repair protein [Desulfonema limicola]
MTKVRILPEILSNKIAAGEVVERPASVVKELVENALDAGSTKIIIEVEKGGRSLIRVSDNGMGMGHDDALLSIERYATSKIYKDEDLFSINTLGFRGEALPSIASVSKFTLETRSAGEPSGIKIDIHGGTIKKVSEIGVPQGTLINVRDLFFNTPARRKFMKTINTEMGHIGDIVSCIALAWPEVHFRLIHNGKTIKNWNSVSNNLERTIDILGSEFRGNLNKLEFESSEISFSGWTANSNINRTTSRGIYVFVNNRFVKDRVVQHALFKGYTGRLMKGRFPAAVLFIKIPPDQVDVNVHPAKNEVRFIRHQEVHDLIAEKVMEALNQADRPGLTQAKDTNKSQVIVPETPEKHDAGRINNLEKHRPAVSEEICTYIGPSINETQDLIKKPDILPEQETLWEKKIFGDMHIIGQFRGTYILCESQEGLILIDQHAAHERVVYEHLKQQALTKKYSSQSLLIPENLELNYQEADILEKMLPGLKAAGLEIEPFGGTTFIIKSLPSIFSNKSIIPMIMEILEKTADIGVKQGIEKAFDESLIIMACHGAIRANHLLSNIQIKGLLNQLDKCENPSCCPHGRPTWIKWSVRFLEKSFNRIV